MSVDCREIRPDSESPYPSFLIPVSYTHLDVYKRQTRSDQYIFRGISRRSELNPSICRKYDRETQTLVNLKDQEFALLHAFRQQASNLLSGTMETLDYVACAQHYGIPTRLIDWTYNPFIALYFALAENKQPDNGEYELFVLPRCV